MNAMLSESMIAELDYVLAMLFYGVCVAGCYHFLLYMRAFFAHARVMVDAEDILFCMAAAVAFFLTAYEKNNGILRWYAFVGAGVGGWLYLQTICVPLETVRKWLLQKRKKTATIKKKRNGNEKEQLRKFKSKGQVSVDESSSPEHKSKKKKRN